MCSTCQVHRRRVFRQPPMGRPALSASPPMERRSADRLAAAATSEVRVPAAKVAENPSGRISARRFSIDGRLAIRRRSRTSASPSHVPPAVARAGKGPVWHPRDVTRERGMGIQGRSAFFRNVPRREASARQAVSAWGDPETRPRHSVIWTEAGLGRHHSSGLAILRATVH